MVDLLKRGKWFEKKLSEFKEEFEGELISKKEVIDFMKDMINPPNPVVKEVHYSRDTHVSTHNDTLELTEQQITIECWDGYLYSTSMYSDHPYSKGDELRELDLIKV